MTETLEHLFLKGEVAVFIWEYFSRAAGLLGPLVQIKQAIRKW